MLNTETVRALVSAFNVNNHFSNTVETNFTLQSRGGKDCIVVSFDKGMKDYQCSEYLYGIKRKIVGEFYGIEEGDTDEVVLNTANLIFDVESFPFNNYKGSWSVGKHGGFEFVAPIDKGVIFNLKSHLASSLVKDVLEGMPTCSIVTNLFNKGKYLCHSKFPNKELCEQFEREFLFRMREKYENAPKNLLKIEGNSVYIKDVFDDARFIDSVIRYKTWLEGMYLGVDSRTNHRVKLFKDMIIEFIGQSTVVTIYDFVCASPLNRKEASILIPLVLDSGRKRILTNEEALKLNCAFNYGVFNDLYGKTQGELSVNGSSGVYGIDFSNPEISHCVVTKIIESSVINKDHELSIDPELHFQALSPAQSPVGMPNRYLSEARVGSPMRSHHDGTLERSPRPGSIAEPPVLLEIPLDVPGTSGEFLPRSHLSSSVTNPHSSKCVSAAKNVPAGTSQPIGYWSSPTPSAEPSLWQPSRPSSWKGANPVGANPWAQRTNPYLSQGTSENKWISSMQFTKPGPSGLSWKGANEWRTSDKPLTEKEKELIEALLYTLNLTNYTFDGVYTNFFAKGEEIVSLLHDNVDRKKYLQAVIGYIIEEYCEDEEKARKVYDLDEFPFKFNYEEKQGKTVVANISSGALSNLKILFSQKFKKDVNAIDISVVKEVEKHEKEKWVGLQLKGCTFTTEEDIKEDVKLAYTSCFPDEGVMKIIPIAFDEEECEYVLDRSRDRSEVRLLRKALPPLTTKEEVQRFLDRVFKTGKTQQELSQEEKELFKALLYAFNYTNKNFDLPDTNFIVKNGKIVSFINDDVDVKEYLQEVIDKAKEEYCKDKKEVYNLDEFPFKFLSNCKKNQKTTVVANISRGALFNLEKLFIYGYKKEKIDINIVTKAVESKKCRLVELKEKGIEREAGYHQRIYRGEAVTASYPDEKVLKDTPIRKYEAGYHLDHDCDNCETQVFSDRLRYTKDRSQAKKMEPEDNKDSGISSGEATDAENVSSKADAITSSGYESMDCENTGGGSPKRSPELSMENLAISTTLNAPQPSPAKKLRSNEV